MNEKILVYGIGNPGREDDGLGFEFVTNLPDSHDYIKNHCYQLNIEDAETFSNFDKVILVDAGKNLTTPFTFTQLVPKPESSFSTHGITMEAVLAMTNNIYDKNPKTYLLALQGESFQIKLGLSDQGKISLSKGLDWFQKNYSNGDSISKEN